jgi:hypothetical protein
VARRRAGQRPYRRACGQPRPLCRSEHAGTAACDRRGRPECGDLCRCQGARGILRGDRARGALAGAGHGRGSDRTGELHEFRRDDEAGGGAGLW